MTVQPGDRPVLDAQVALRPERFGALAYHFGNRRLSFLKHPDLVAVVRLLDGTTTVAEAFDAAGVAEGRRPSFLRALTTLVGSGILTVEDERAA
ncbi:MAG: mycofactocin biosynthesis chaperone MftB [Microthrixaceae bacterium]